MTAAPLKVVKPLVWSTVSSLGTQFLSFATFVVLARIVGAEAFGLVALSALTLDIFLMLSSVGIYEAIIQRATLEDEAADTAFWTNLFFGTCFCGVVATLSPVIANYFKQPEAAPIISTLALIFIITPFGAIHGAKLARTLNFRAIATRNLAASLAGACVGLPLAFAGYGVWALVWQRLSVALVTVVFVWLATKWKPSLRFKRSICKELLGFGGRLALASTLNQTNIRITDIFSAIVSGPVAVAYIRAASRVAEVLSQMTLTPFQQIALPLLSRERQASAEFRNTYLKMSKLSASIMFPSYFGLFAVADPVVDLLFGRDWEPVADAIRIFSCAAIAAQINNSVVSALSATGHSKIVLRWTIIQIVTGFCAAVASYQWGWRAMLVAGVARAYIILPYSLHLLHAHARIHWLDALYSIKFAGLASLTMCAFVVMMSQFLHSIQIAGYFTISTCIIAGISLYVVVYYISDRKFIQEVYCILQNSLSPRFRKG